MSTTTSNKSKAAVLAGVQALIAGTQQHFPSGSFTLGDVAFTTASLVRELQDLAEAMQKVTATETAVKDARAALKTTAAKVKPVVSSYRRYLLLVFANAAQKLADFGLEPAKGHKPLTAEQQAAATAKARATRKARGTTGKKQKLAIKGNVTGVVVTPVTQPTHRSPTQPSSNASSPPVASINAPST